MKKQTIFNLVSKFAVSNLQLTFPLGAIFSIIKLPDSVADLGVFSVCFLPCTRHIHLNMVLRNYTVILKD